MLPLTLAVVTVLSVTGPWSLIAASRHSQQTRLAGAMHAAGIEWNATAVSDTTIPTEPHREITETARYLLSHFGHEALPPLLAAHAAVSEPYMDIVYAAGLRPLRPETDTQPGGYGQLENGAVLDRTDDGTLYYIRLNPPVVRPRPLRPRSEPAGGAAASGLRDPGAASLMTRIPVAGLTLFADLTPISRMLPGSRGMSSDFARIPLTDESGRQRGDLFVLEIGVGGGEVHQLVAIARIPTP